MITSNEKKKPVEKAEKIEFEKLRKKLNALKPQTDLGRTLLEISKRGLESGVGILGADEVMDELGRTRYE